ncbi:MAG: hypothetical protein A2151_04930 [Candidatus Muproteobacteria bacterium RBG_16_65_34]|uniref:SoxXA-binding protein n=1 Tax=Candidatus Muproteobacteria bacterium RBG_16_65_34 TaxID=1817760 RepID=A0A1F6TKB3_9PROT|nr:MAG: hypothetical protein A2151_04930 [Candidatus Muproteobacteria bacterium RBG_16_65_34]
MKKYLLLIALAASVAGCAGGPSKDEEYDNLLAQAENEIKLAGKAGFLWRDTEKFLADSKEAMAGGDRDKAMKLAKKALKEAQLAQQQARDNASAGPSYSN